MALMRKGTSAATATANRANASHPRVGSDAAIATHMAETPFEASFRQSISTPGKVIPWLFAPWGPFGHELPNEAVNLFKIEIAHFRESKKAVNLLKINLLTHRKPSTD
jgi:hypothetical protein